MEFNLKNLEKMFNKVALAGHANQRSQCQHFHINKYKMFDWSNIGLLIRNVCLGGW